MFRNDTHLFALTAPRMRFLVGVAFGLLGLFFYFGVIHISLKVDPVDNEFANLWAASHFTGNPAVYQPEALKRVLDPVGQVIPARLYFCRWPYFLFLIWPLHLLSYSAGFVLWRCVQAACACVFVFLWPTPDRPTLLAVACWSMPLVLCIVIAQDVTLLLPVLAGFVLLSAQGRNFTAGLLLSFLIAKPQLFVFLPIVLVAKRQFRTLVGWAAGTGALFAISTATMGWGWPLLYLRTLANPEMHPYVDKMPGLRVLLGSEAGIFAFLAIAVAFTFLTWRAGRLLPLCQAMMVAITAGLLVNTHSYLLDCVLLLPVTGELLSHPDWKVRGIGLLLASPIPFLGIIAGWAWVLRFLLVVVAVVLSFGVPRRDVDASNVGTELAAVGNGA